MKSQYKHNIYIIFDIIFENLYSFVQLRIHHLGD